MRMLVINTWDCRIFIFSRKPPVQSVNQSFRPSMRLFIRLSVHQSGSMQQKQLPCCSSHSCECVCVVRVFVPIISCSCLLIKCVKRRHLISFSYLQRSDMAYTQRTDQAFTSPPPLSLSPSLSITASNQLKPLASRCVALAHWKVNVANAMLFFGRFKY